MKEYVLSDKECMKKQRLFEKFYKKAFNKVEDFKLGKIVYGCHLGEVRICSELFHDNIGVWFQVEKTKFEEDDMFPIGTKFMISLNTSLHTHHLLFKSKEVSDEFHSLDWTTSGEIVYDEDGASMNYEWIRPETTIFIDTWSIPKREWSCITNDFIDQGK